MDDKLEKLKTKILGKHISNDDLHNEYDIYKAMDEYADAYHKSLEQSASSMQKSGEHWAIKFLVEVKLIIERYNKELPGETSGCSNHVYNEV